MKLIIDVPDNVYAKVMEYYEHNQIVEAVYGYIYRGTPIPDNATVCDIEQIRTEIEESRYGLVNDGLDLALKIIDKHIK